MDKQMVVSLIVLVLLLEAFVAYLFVNYKRGKIDQNPFNTLIVKESRVLYYAFFKWKGKKQVGEHSFLLHKNSTYFWLFIALLHEQVIEMVVFHIYLKKLDPTYALFISGLHVYSIFYMMGDYNWVRNSPIRINGNRIEMKIGARREISFHLHDIQVIQKASLKYSKSGGIIHETDVFHATAFPRVLTKVFGITDELKHEIIFKEPVVYKGYFGLKKKVNKVLVYIDDSDRFANVLQQKMEVYEEEKKVRKQDNVVSHVKSPLIHLPQS